MRIAIGMGDDERRPAGAVHHARGQNAQHAAMPLRVVEDEAIGGIRAVGVDQGQQLAVDGVERARLGVAAVLVEAVELHRQLAGAGRDRG